MKSGTQYHFPILPVRLSGSKYLIPNPAGVPELIRKMVLCPRLEAEPDAEPELQTVEVEHVLLEGIDDADGISRSKARVLDPGLDEIVAGLAVDRETRA